MRPCELIKTDLEDFKLLTNGSLLKSVNGILIFLGVAPSEQAVVEIIKNHQSIILCCSEQKELNTND